MAVVKTLKELSNDIKVAATSASWATWKFGYLGEVNSSTSTTYPLILLTPPSSSYENPYKNEEVFRLEFHLYQQQLKEYDDLGNLAAPNDNDTLEATYDSLQNRFFEMISALCMNNEHKYVVEGGWELERISQVHNDLLVGLEITIRLRKFSTPCLSYSTKPH